VALTFGGNCHHTRSAITLIFVDGTEIHLHGRLVSCTRILCLSSSFATESYKGIASDKKFVEASTTKRVAVQKDTKKVDAFLANSDASRKTNRLSLNISEEINMILAIERGLACNHFKQDSANAPEVCFGIVPEEKDV